MNRREFLDRFGVEKHIIGTEFYEMNQDILKGISEEEIIEKARSGFYKDTAENRKLGRVGKSYGFSNKLDKDSYNTADRYFRNGKWNTKRVKDVHYDILNDTFRGVKSAKGTPTCVIVMGGTASGKGHVAKPMLEDITNSVGEKFAHLDVDDFKKKIPEYNKFKRLEAANNVHEESSHLGKRARKFAISNKLNFVNDGTFSNMDKALDMIKSLKNKGYNVKLINVSTDVSEAKKREKVRFERSGRKVGEDVLEKSHIKSVDVYNKIKGLVDEYSLYDNNVSLGEKAVLVDSHDKGVINEKLYKKFQDKKNYKPKAYKKK